MTGLLGIESPASTPSGKAKSKNVRFVTSPAEGEAQSEWDTVVEVWGVETPAEFKAKLFAFMEGVKAGTMTVTHAEA